MHQANAEIERLIAALYDHSPEGPSFSNCGLVDYVPGRDFPACRRAVDELVALGTQVVPRMRQAMRQPHSIEAYFAVEVLGRLDDREAIPELEQLVRSQASVSRRINFDQFVEYPVFDQAFNALHRMDSKRATELLDKMANSKAGGCLGARDRMSALR